MLNVVYNQLRMLTRGNQELTKSDLNQPQEFRKLFKYTRLQTFLILPALPTENLLVNAKFPGNFQGKLDNILTNSEFVNYYISTYKLLRIFLCNMTMVKRQEGT